MSDAKPPAPRRPNVVPMLRRIGEVVKTILGLVESVEQLSPAGPGGPSQRQLHVVELVRQVAAVLTMTLVMRSPAIAEVCDKVVGYNWTPQDGPVWMFNLTSSLPLGFILVG